MAEVAERQTADVVQFKQSIAIEDLPCVLNPVEACDLKQILLMTRADRRLAVACAFADLSIKDAFQKAGLIDDDSDKGNAAWRRWTRGENKLPLGAAFRVARVLGVPAEILFQSPTWYT